jgi:hypothetical protein
VQFPKEQFGDQPIVDFHVRGSDEKQLISLNKRIVCLILTSDSLYFWNPSMGSAKFVMFTSCQTFNRINDSSVLVSYQDEVKFELTRLDIEFTQFEQEIIYEESQEFDTIKSFSYDYSQNILMMLKRKNNKKKGSKSIKIVDLNDEKVLLNMRKVEHRELIGRLKCQEFSLIDGHMYFNNQVVKIRYDLLKKQDSAFDY